MGVTSGPNIQNIQEIKISRKLKYTYILSYQYVQLRILERKHKLGSFVLIGTIYDLAIHTCNECNGDAHFTHIEKIKRCVEKNVA